MALTAFQIILISSLIIIIPIGIWNMKRMKAKKAEEELLGDEMYSSPNSSSTIETQNLGISPEIESQIKQYIEQYKSTYPKESIQQGILSYGITNEQAKSLVDKYF